VHNRLAEKPRQGFWGLWNISFGFFGIQIGFALQNANMSRIFQSLGTSVDDLAFLWIAAPLTGLIVQPLIGHFSDRTWTRLGRRRPFFLAGAVLATLALFGMPNAPVLFVAALLLWVLDASLNISMEPFRAFVGDMLDKKQQTAGYAFQTAFIGAGAVLGSLAPKLLTDVLDLSNTAAPGVVPDSVRWAFYLGGAALFSAVLWTVLTTREYPPEQLAGFDTAVATVDDSAPHVASPLGAAWALVGAGVCVAVAAFGLDKPVYVLGGMLIAFGLAQIASRWWRARGERNVLTHVINDLATMPAVMRRLAVVQLFTWSALFIMWIYTTPVVAQNFFGSADPTSAAYNRGADWVGELFAIYNGIAALWAFAMPALAARIGRARTHIVGLLAGALGYASFLFLHSPEALVGSMVLIGIAWGSILTMPYAILARTLPPAKLGVYMGLFNIFIVVPQLIVSSIMGTVLRLFAPGNPLLAMGIAAGVLALAAAAMVGVDGADEAG
jgi:maltose/moltooligosaccharide transporter